MFNILNEIKNLKTVAVNTTAKFDLMKIDESTSKKSTEESA